MPLIDLPFNRLASPTLYYPIRRGLRVWWWHLLQFSKASRGPFGSKDNSCPRSYRYHRHTTMMAVIIIIRESITHGWLDGLSSRHYYEALGELTTWSRCDEVKGNISSSFYYYMRYLVRNHLQVSSLKSVFVNEKIFISFYKISIFDFTKIVLGV